MASTEIGEYLVGAYLKLVDVCDVVDYNVRPPGGGLSGLSELDVVGFRFSDRTVFLCEVTTHTRGVLYGNQANQSAERIAKKYETQKAYADKYLSGFENRVFQFWAPVVPRGKLTKSLESLDGLQLVCNGDYKRRVEILLAKAREEKHDTSNPVFRIFQILGSLRE